MYREYFSTRINMSNGTMGKKVRNTFGYVSFEVCFFVLVIGIGKFVLGNERSVLKSRQIRMHFDRLHRACIDELVQSAQLLALRYLCYGFAMLAYALGGHWREVYRDVSSAPSRCLISYPHGNERQTDARGPCADTQKPSALGRRGYSSQVGHRPSELDQTHRRKSPEHQEIARPTQ